MSIFQKISGLLGQLGHTLEEFWHNDLEPWLVDLGTKVEHDIVGTLMPFAAEALAEIGNVIGSDATIEQKADNIGQALTLTIKKAAAAGIAVTEHDAATAIASVAASVSKGADAANQPVVAQVASIPAPKVDPEPAAETASA